MTILEMQDAMQQGKSSARELCEYYLARIEQLDRSGPKVNSVIALNPDALAIADTLDQERKAGSVRGPLHGIPILLKDNIDTRDRMQTTAGSLALEGNYAVRDALLVEQLRAAGAVLLGKTNLSEWANFRGKHSISGWSSRGGLTRNPYALDRTACGSSSGSGAAVTADFCAAAIGTETDGSIICPAQTNGIVGIKPTLGLISRRGVIPIAHSQDTPGPMARTVTDAATVLGALTGVDPQDAATRSNKKRAGTDYRMYLDANGLQGARIGVARKLAGTDARLLKILDDSIAVIRALGAVVIDPVEVPNFNKLGKTELDVLHFEFKADLDRYLGALGPEAKVHSIRDVIQFNEQHRDQIMPYFGQEHMETAQGKGPLTSKRYLNALAKNQRLARQEGLDAALRKRRLHALILPSGGPAWVIDLVNGDASNWDMESTSLAAIAGYPHITVPAGFIFGLPVGLSFIGRAWQEGLLIRMAYAFEQATQARQAPKFLEHAAA